MVSVQHDGKVTIPTLTRTSALNTLCDELITDLNMAMDAAKNGPGCHCLVLTGEGRAFAAGADIKEMAPL